MNYKHAFHAGNFADVHKHVVLTLVLHHLREKDAAFRVLDTHAGAGLYDLTGPEAMQTQEWQRGIGRVVNAPLSAEAEPLLRPYLDFVRKFNHGAALRCYPGSPALSLALLRPQDRLLACEVVPDAARALAAHFGRDARAKALSMDGWVGLGAFVPPKERRGLVMIDPPYENAEEFAQVADKVTSAHRKWPTGIYLVWYPVTERARSEALLERIKASCLPKVFRAELSVGAWPAAEGLRGSGLVVINPPWRLHDQLAVVLPALAAILAQPEQPATRLEWLSP